MTVYPWIAEKIEVRGTLLQGRRIPYHRHPDHLSMSTYFAILTEVGEAKLANAIALGQTLKLKKMGVGDGNGDLPIPDRTQKTLVHEMRRAGLNQLAIDPANTSQIIVEQSDPKTWAAGGYAKLASTTRPATCARGQLPAQLQAPDGRGQRPHASGAHRADRRQHGRNRTEN